MKSQRPYPRTVRVAQQIQAILGEIATKHIDLSHLGFITFTHVNLTADLKQAQVYYSVIKPLRSLSEIQREFKRLKKAFKKFLAPELTLKNTPELTFFYDDTFDYSEHLETIFKKIHSTKKPE